MTPPGLDERSLFEACLNRNADAFNILVQKYQSYVRALTYSATGSLEESEEIAQDVFLIVWRNLSQLRDYSKLKSWLYQITKNEIIKYYRKESHNVLSRSLSADSAQELQASYTNPVESALSREQQEHIHQALNRIPDHYREPLILFYWEGRSVRQVAEMFDLNEAAAKKRISRGREMLKTDMESLVEKSLSKTSDRTRFSAAVLGLIGASEFCKSTAAAGITQTAGTSAGAKSGILLTLWHHMTVKIASIVIITAAGLGTGAYLLSHPNRNSADETITVLPPELNKGLVLYYSFDSVIENNEPKMALDESDFKNHGKLTGGNFTEGRIGRAFNCSVANKKDGIIVNDHPSLDLDAVTIAVWVKTDRLDDQWGRIVDKGWRTAYNLCIGGEYKGKRWPDKCSFECATYTVSSQTPVVDGKWHFIAGTYDGWTMRLYIDGRLDAQQQSKKKIMMKHTNTDIHIGSLAVPEEPPHDEAFFDGLIDELRLYNRVLSEQEIQLLYHYKPQF